MRAIIGSISSDIGMALARHWHGKGWEIAGTFRTGSEGVSELDDLGALLLHADFSDVDSIKKVCSQLADQFGEWDVLVVCPASLEPVGLFEEINFDDWRRSIELNFTNQLGFIHALLPNRRAGEGECPSVITWAGGGVNDAPQRYSAYTLSKIAQVKMMELLDAEIADTKFVILGPGWVHTKIHNETLAAGSVAGDNFDKTSDKLKSGGWTQMDRVLSCCDWVISVPREIVGGRNFSVAHDAWGEASLGKALSNDADMYKLRRNKNDWSDKTE